MDDYDPHNHRATGASILSAWVTAAIFVLVVTITISLAKPIEAPAGELITLAWRPC
jgi:hypothetical protein